jgi:serine/threonine protein kinase
MSELSIGATVTLAGGGSAKVKKELGRGGQGIVYLVNVNGEDKALKWYINVPNRDFYKNLQDNIRKGAPSPAFLWPEYLTDFQNGSFGYIMMLRPQNYFEFGHFLLAKVKFKSFDAIFTAAMKICDGFMMLHRFGFSYQDLNDGNFFIDPQSGDVLICDNDNVMPQGEKSGIMGKARYMAPEIVNGGIPDKYSDRFSLSVILFMLFYLNHPFEGAKVAACPCLTESFEKRFYGSEAIFIYDEKDNTNLPVKGVHQNVIKRWPVLPQILRDTFTKQFSQECLKNPKERLIEQEWKKNVCSLRDQLICCPHCKGETFAKVNQSVCKCINCGKEIDTSLCLAVNNRVIPLSLGTKVYFSDEDTPSALVAKDAKGFPMLQNNTSNNWYVDTRGGSVKEVIPKGYMPIIPSLKISMKIQGNDIKAEIQKL